jgi:hypothetical protein
MVVLGWVASKWELMKVGPSTFENITLAYLQIINGQFMSITSKV